MKIVAIVQARMGSTRLPEKVLKPVFDAPTADDQEGSSNSIIEVLLSRLLRAEKLDEVVVATSTAPENERLAECIHELGLTAYQGSENDVLDRFYQAAKLTDADVVVRITGDCPLVDPALVDRAVSEFLKADVDYLSNVSPATYPDGLDVEVFSFAALESSWQSTTDPYHREHVTPHLRESGMFTVCAIENDEDLSALRWTVDEPADLDVVRAIFKHFSPRTDFSWREVLKLQRESPELFAHNQAIGRNEGAVMGTGQKLWKRAKTLIPGGNMLLSKRAEMFLPDQWPAYFSKAKGCRVWDLDDKEYIDMSIMGIGTNTLGYGHPEVDAAVSDTVAAGNMSTFNCPEEVYLAEKLIELHPWADMARFTRGGGEANAVAIRIARAAAGKDKVAICGYHGWHDWYLSANLSDDKNLDGHLLPGLEPRGVPRELKGSVLPFNYNDYDGLLALVTEHDIGVIKMEVVRNAPPADGFLEKVRELATKRGIVLMFDECSSGFRETFGGIHKKYGVEPDLAMFGKALGNGYAINAVIGKREIMEAAQSTFISSTFWTERIGPAAALATLEVMERLRSWEQITQTGQQISERWKKLANKHGLSITTSGIPAFTAFAFKSEDTLAYKTLITQEMLKQGYLASNTVYTCTEHTSDVVDGYFAALEPIFSLIRECEDGRDVHSLLNGPVCHSGFKRLN